MPQSTTNLMVTADHVVPISPLGGSALVANSASSATLFFSDTPNVSATRNQGSIVASQSRTFTSPVWLISAGTSTVSVSVYTNPQAVTVGADGSVSIGTAAVAASSNLLYQGIRPSISSSVNSGITVASRTADQIGNNVAPGNMPAATAITHTVFVACSDIRLHYSVPISNGNVGANSVDLHVGVTLPDTNTYEVTFKGQRWARLDPGGPSVVSDPIPFDFVAGNTFTSRTFIAQPMGAATTLAALSNINDTALTLTALPRFPCGLVQVDTSANLELVEFTGAFTGTGPFVCNTKYPLTIAHANGVTVQQQGFTNQQAFDDSGDLSSAPTSGGKDFALSGSIQQTGFTATTTAAPAAINDTTLSLTGTPWGAASGCQITVDTAGQQEVLSVRTITGTANPFTAWLSTPCTKTHSSGVTVTGNLRNGTGLSPQTITADRIYGTRPKVVVVAGDSIAAGTGNNIRPNNSFSTQAFNNVLPFYNLAKAGESLQQFLVFATGRTRYHMFNLGDWLFDQYGTNDVYGGRTLAQLQADKLTLWTKARNRGMKIAACTLTPRTTSTDQFITGTNQTIVGPATTNLVRQAHNAWLRSGAANVDMVVDCASAVEANSAGVNTLGGDYWVADANGPYTADGIHPGHLGAALMAAKIQIPLFT